MLPRHVRKYHALGSRFIADASARCHLKVVKMYEVIDRAAFDEAGGPAGAPDAVVASGTRLALVGGFLPRRCGIATFPTDIHDSLKVAVPDLAVDIYAMTPATNAIAFDTDIRSEEHTSELQSLMRSSYAVFCLKKKTTVKT